MLPTSRLLIAAIFASVVAWTCGFAVFAAFRVNHEPLSRLPAVTAPLQLVADETALGSPALSADAGLPYRPQPPRPSEALTGGMEASAPALTPVRLEAVDPPHPGPRAAKTEKTVKPAAALRERQGVAVASAVAGASLAVSTSVAATPPPSSAARPAVAVAPPPAAAAPLPRGSTKPSAPIAVSVAAAPASTLVPATAAALAARPATRPATGVKADAAAKKGGAAKQAAKPVIAAIVPPAIERPAAIGGAISQIPPSQAKSPAKTVRKPGRRTALAPRLVERRRVAFKQRPIRRVPIYAGTRYGPNQEPVFQSAPGYARQSQDSGSYANSFRSDGY